MGGAHSYIKLHLEEYTEQLKILEKNVDVTIKIMQLCNIDTIVKIQINETKKPSIDMKQNFKL